jgi:antitoxin component of MazEF toxin-antitoxin module
MKAINQIVQNGESLYVLIPKKIVEDMKLSKGDSIEYDIIKKNE